MTAGWQLKKLSSTRYGEIVFYVLTVVLSTVCIICLLRRLERFADKTRQAIAFEQLRTNARILSCTLGRVL